MLINQLKKLHFFMRDEIRNFNEKPEHKDGLFIELTKQIGFYSIIQFPLELMGDIDDFYFFIEKPDYSQVKGYFLLNNNIYCRSDAINLTPLVDFTGLIKESFFRAKNRDHNFNDRYEIFIQKNKNQNIFLRKEISFYEKKLAFTCFEGNDPITCQVSMLLSALEDIHGPIDKRLIKIISRLNEGNAFDLLTGEPREPQVSISFKKVEQALRIFDRFDYYKSVFEALSATDNEV